MVQYVFKMPDVGEGTAEAEIVAWHIAVGDRVREDQPMVDVMTDKATVELPSPVAGRVVALHGAPGEMATVGAPLVVFERDGEEPVAESATTAALPSAVSAVSEPIPAFVARAGGPDRRDGGGGDLPAPDQPAPVAKPVARTARKVLASPAVRRRALDMGIPLGLVAGRGPAGRVTQADLDAYAAHGAEMPAPGRPVERQGVTEVRVIGLRRRIAERMAEAKRTIPHFSYIEEVDVTALEDLRLHLNGKYDGRREKLTILAFLMRALVRAVDDFPQINALYDGEAGVLKRSGPVHIGIAAATPGGLMVPVVRHAEARDLWDAAAEVARLARAAREGRATRDELQGSTITISSLGPLGGIAATPVINPPEVAIVGVNKVVERPMVREGQIVVRKMMNLSSSFDHRVVDGWDAASFIQTVKGLLEHPATLFLE
ncbi:MAG: 2-oxo acid dehydrogenase subunit E2 [Telmatospirillum sp.]|nr:2-oxo acid dehydrogenase subunit E2 [Telmatospirillum sp.]